MSPRALRSTLFPYTTLFRSSADCGPEVRAPQQQVEQRGGVEQPRKEQLIDAADAAQRVDRSEEHTSELQSLRHLVCRLLLEKKKTRRQQNTRNRDATHVIYV